MPKIIAIANQKGGVGKTTTAINLSASISAAEQKTLLIDIDPQANSTSGMGIENEDGSIYQVMLGIEEATGSIQDTYMPFLDILPADINLVGAEVEMVPMENREFLLRKALDSIKDKYDFIFIDCPPSRIINSKCSYRCRLFISACAMRIFCIGGIRAIVEHY